MARLIVLALLVAALAACSEAGPRGYGYAANERPSLVQLGFASGGADTLAAAMPTQDRSAQDKQDKAVQ
ncbi:MAG TPA: hypothetical protein VGF92_14930 [Stellaceae bacterium]|jgi:hypothetical protein